MNRLPVLLTFACSVLLVSALVGGAAGAAFADPYSPNAYVPVQTVQNVDYRADFCVIGAGFSGVKAIETLAVEGNVTNWLLIEAQNRIGGRVRTVPVGGYNVEMHAQWVQGDLRNPILALGAEMNPPLGGGHSKWDEYDYYDVNGVLRNQGSNSLTSTISAVWAAWTCVYNELMPLFNSGVLADMSMHDCYALCGFAPVTAEEYAIEAALIGVEWGEVSDITSCQNTGWWVAYSFYGDDAHTGTANFVNDARGLSAVAEHILLRKGIALTDARIHYNTRVTRVDTTTNVVTATRGGQTKRYQCQALINTMAIGALQKDLRENTTPPTQLITPRPLLSVQASVHQYHMAVYRKTFLQYQTKFWGNKAHFTITPRDAGLMVSSWTSVDYPTYYPGSRILLVSQNGPESNRYINMPDAEYARRIAQELEYVFGPAASFANVTAYFSTRDTYEIDNYGSYSNRPPVLTAANFRAMWAPIGGHYFWAGEAACDLLNGYVVGAYHIGRSAAQRALVNLGRLPMTVNPEDNDCYRPPPGWRP